MGRLGICVAMLGLVVALLVSGAVDLAAGLVHDEAAESEQPGGFSAASLDRPLAPTSVYTYSVPFVTRNHSVPTWESLGLREIWVRSTAVAPRGVLYAGTHEHGLYKSCDSGETWFPINDGLRESATILQVEVDPFDPWTVYVSSNHATPWFFYSHDGGESWLSGGYNSHPVLELKAHPAIPGRLFMGDATLDWAGGRLYKSDDSGLSWSMVIHDMVRANSIAAPVRSQSPVYVGTYLGLYRSQDGGNNWSKLTNGLPDGPVWAVALHPNEPLSAYVSTEAGIFKTSDGGDTWSKWGIDAPSYAINDLLINSRYPGIQYASFFYTPGVYISLDEGRHWQPMNAGLGNHAVWDLVLDRTSSRLYAATVDGIWVVDLVPRFGSHGDLPQND